MHDQIFFQVEVECSDHPDTTDSSNFDIHVLAEIGDYIVTGWLGAFFMSFFLTLLNFSDSFPVVVSRTQSTIDRKTTFRPFLEYNLKQVDSINTFYERK